MFSRFFHAGCIDKEKELEAELKRSQALVLSLKAHIEQLQEEIQTSLWKKNLVKPKRKYTKSSVAKLSE
jgi:hypothetical protein